MARLNEILVGRFNRGLQKLFGLKGEPPVATLAPEIIPGHNLFSGVENRYLEGWDRFFTNVGEGAVAANQSGLRFRNPVNSNIIAVIEALWIQGPASGANNMLLNNGTANSDLAVNITSNVSGLDTRGRLNPAMIISGQNSAPAVPALTTTNNFFSAGPLGQLNIITDENQEITVLPGSAIQLVASLVNIAIGMSICWRERFLEESERT